MSIVTGIYNIGGDHYHAVLIRQMHYKNITVEHVLCLYAGVYKIGGDC